MIGYYCYHYNKIINTGKVMHYCLPMGCKKLRMVRSKKHLTRLKTKNEKKIHN